MVGVATTLKWVFDLKEEDRWWCAADPAGSPATATSCTARCLGATSFMYEGAPNYPYPNRWWKMIEQVRHHHLYTAPTAIRGLMRFGDAWPGPSRPVELRLWASVGEPINPEAWRWYHRVIGKGAARLSTRGGRPRPACS
jgi:acetyl-CoA synthetase